MGFGLPVDRLEVFVVGKLHPLAVGHENLLEFVALFFEAGCFFANSLLRDLGEILFFVLSRFLVFVPRQGHDEAGGGERGE